jgi:gamma-glutamyltranspeptidase/glutathione hydrolase
MPPPSSGGVHIIQMLNMIAADDLPKMGFHKRESVHLLVEVMKRAYADRARFLGDTDFVDVPLTQLLSKDYAKTQRDSIEENRATPSLELRSALPGFKESPSTTHISVVDSFGNGVSTTQTINYTFGSGVVARGTGILLNNEMDDFSIKAGEPNAYSLVGGEANAIAGGKTMLSSMSPTFVVGEKGKLEMVVGAPGGSYIITATLQTIINYLDYKLPLDKAVHAYRVHHQWLPDEISVEYGGLSLKTVQALERQGYRINFVTKGMGDVQAIARSGSGWIGVSDTRSIGKPMGY